MRAAEAIVPPLAGEPASGVEHHRAHQRVWLDETPAASRELQGVPHPEFEIDHNSDPGFREIFKNRANSAMDFASIQCTASRGARTETKGMPSNLPP
jgi:hypothetical protein